MLIANIGYPIANNYLFRSCSVVTKPDPMKSNLIALNTTGALSHAADFGTTSAVKNIFGLDIYK